MSEKKKSLDDVLNDIVSEADSKAASDKAATDKIANSREEFDRGVDVLVGDFIKPLFDKIERSLKNANLHARIEQRPSEPVRIGSYHYINIIGIRFKSPSPTSTDDAHIFLGRFDGYDLTVYATGGKDPFTHKVVYRKGSAHSLKDLQSSCDQLEAEIAEATSAIHKGTLWGSPAC